MKYQERVARYVNLVNKYLHRNKDKGKYEENFIKGYVEGIKSGINWGHNHKHWRLVEDELPQFTTKEEFKGNHVVHKSDKMLCVCEHNGSYKYTTGQYCRFVSNNGSESMYWCFDSHIDKPKPIAWLMNFEFSIDECNRND